MKSNKLTRNKISLCDQVPPVKPNDPSHDKPKDFKITYESIQNIKDVHVWLIIIFLGLVYFDKMLYLSFEATHVIMITLFYCRSGQFLVSRYAGISTVQLCHHGPLYRRGVPFRLRKLRCTHHTVSQGCPDLVGSRPSNLGLKTTKGPNSKF